jgi:hypothetical protein
LISQRELLRQLAHERQQRNTLSTNNLSTNTLSTNTFNNSTDTSERDDLVRNNLQQTDTTVDHVLPLNEAAEDESKCTENDVDTTHTKTRNGHEKSSRQLYTTEEIRFLKEDVPDGLSPEAVLALYTERFGPGRTISAILNIMRLQRKTYFNKTKRPASTRIRRRVRNDDYPFVTNEEVLPDTTQSTQEQLQHRIGMHVDEDSQIDSESAVHEQSESDDVSSKRRKTTKGPDYSSGDPYSVDEQRFLMGLAVGKTLSGVYRSFTQRFGNKRSKGAIKAYLHRHRRTYFHRDTHPANIERSTRATRATVDVPEERKEASPATTVPVERKEVVSEPVHPKQDLILAAIKNLSECLLKMSK